MKKILYSLLIFICSYSAYATDDYTFFDQHFNDYSENLEDAIDAKKDGIFIFFHMEECPFCQKMRHNVLSQKPIINYFKQHFLNFEVDVESSVNLTDFNGNNVKDKNESKVENSTAKQFLKNIVNNERNLIYLKKAWKVLDNQDHKNIELINKFEADIVTKACLLASELPEEKILEYLEKLDNLY